MTGQMEYSSVRFSIWTFPFPTLGLDTIGAPSAFRTGREGNSSELYTGHVSFSLHVLPWVLVHVLCRGSFRVLVQMFSVDVWLDSLSCWLSCRVRHSTATFLGLSHFIRLSPHQKTSAHSSTAYMSLSSDPGQHPISSFVQFPVHKISTGR